MTNKKRFIGSKAEKFIGFFLTFVGVTGLAMTLYTLFATQSAETRANIEMPYNEAKTIVVNGDTTRRIYVVQDSTSGIIWVGIGGRNQIK